MNSKSRSSRFSVLWRCKAKRLFPNRIFASLICLASGLVAFLCFGVAINIPVWPMAIPGLLFCGVGVLAGTAVFTPANFELASRDYFLKTPQQDKSTIAILILLLGVTTSLLAISMHIFRAIFPNGPGSPKYLITVGIAVACGIFMKQYGNRIVRNHFGQAGGRGLILSGKQAFAVALFMLGIGLYIAWLLAE